MKQLTIDSYEPDAAVIRVAAGVLRAGGVVAYPTDTLYGLAVDPQNDAAVRKLFAVKARDRAAAITLIAATLEQACDAGDFGPQERRLASAFWPGPLTIVVRASSGLSSLIPNESGTVGIRVPAHTVARALAHEFGGPITATSANISGHPPATTADEAIASIGDRIDAILDAGPVPGGPPSSIVEITAGRPTFHRAGAIAWDRVLESLQ